jgi:hypothetical protein
MIAETILSKIDSATAIVSDITIIGNTESGRPTPNPNVLMELGYALKALPPERLVMVMNEAFGSLQDLPFDLRHRRILRYNLNEGAEPDVRSRVKRELQRDFENAIREILTLSVRQGDIPRCRRQVDVDFPVVANNHRGGILDFISCFVIARFHSPSYSISAKRRAGRCCRDYALDTPPASRAVSCGLGFLTSGWVKRA